MSRAVDHREIKCSNKITEMKSYEDFAAQSPKTPEKPMNFSEDWMRGKKNATIYQTKMTATLI